ncbi:MAG: SDR family NAD(P)-dependent oxidoreductase [Mycobacterium sp.]
MYETNVWSPLHLSLDLIGALRASSRGGAIANVTSAAGYISPDLHGIYGSSKSAAAALTQIMRIELAREGITVTEVVPGPVDTQMLDVSRRAPFAALALRLLPPGTPAGMAHAMLQAVERRRARVIYPWHTVPPVVFPGFGRWAMRVVASRRGTTHLSKA